MPEGCCRVGMKAAAQVNILLNSATLQVGDALFNWSLRQLVDLSYMWSTAGDPMQNLPVQLPLPNVLS